MIRTMFSRVLIAASLFGVATALPACSSTDSSKETATTGTLALPLVTHVGANTYRLNAYIQISGPIFTYLYTDGDTTQTVLTTTLPTGSYSAYLYSWSLEKLDENGVFVPIQANLISNWWVGFTIYNQASTSISYQFETTSETVTVGAGNLNISFGVTETPPACTALGDSCGEGYWCPPGQLTGSLLACVPAGTVAVGESCVSPTDCVANSTCMDLGAGSVCTALCSAADFGAACASGGTCTFVASQYGACVPDGGSVPPPDGGGDGGAGAGGAGG